MSLHRPPTRPRTFVEKVAKKAPQPQLQAAIPEELAVEAATLAEESANATTPRPKRNGSRPRNTEIFEATAADRAEMQGFVSSNHLPPSFRDPITRPKSAIQQALAPADDREIPVTNFLR